MSLFIVYLLVGCALVAVVTAIPTASADVTHGATADVGAAGTPYIRDDSSAIPIWGIGSTSSAVDTDRLEVVNVVLDTTGTGMRPSKLKELDIDGEVSGMAIFRDDGTVDDELDGSDTALDLGSIYWSHWNGDHLCRMQLENEWVPTAAEAVGSYEWFVVVRTDPDIDEGDILRTRINANGIWFSDDSAQPSKDLTSRNTEVVKTEYQDVGTGYIGRNLTQAALALTIVDGGPHEYIDELTIRIEDDGGFDMSDLANIGTNPSTSGIALYRDDGSDDDVWDASDTGITASDTRVAGTRVTLDLDAEPIPDSVRGSLTHFVVIHTSDTIDHNDGFTVRGDWGSIQVDGTPDTKGDQDLTTPEDGRSDRARYIADVITPTITETYWEEDSPYLHVDGDTLYFSSQMTSGQDATFVCDATDNAGGSRLDRAGFSYEPSLDSGGGEDDKLLYTYDYVIDSEDDDGSSPATVTVHDEAGNSVSADLDYTEDNGGPSVTITSPSAMDMLYGTVTITATANDTGAGVDPNDAWVTWDYGGSWSKMTWTGSGFEFTFDTATQGDGPYRIVVRVRDRVYNEGTDHVNVVLDNTGPSVSFVEPTNGRYVHSDRSFEVLAAAYDPLGVGSVEARTDGGSWVPMTYDAALGLWTGTLDAPGAGDHVLEVRGTDAGDNLGMPSSIIVIGDANDPTATIVSPSQGSERSGRFVVQVEADDAERLEGVTVTLEGGPTDLTFEAVWNPVTSMWEVAIDTSDLPGGTYNITAVARDEAGRGTARGPVEVLFDNAVPSLAIVRPVEGQYVFGTITVEAMVDDGHGSGFDGGRVQLSVDGWTPVGMTLSGGTWTVDLDTYTLGDGHHTLTVVATDDAGNEASHSILIVVDNNALDLTLVQPVDGDVVSSNLTVTVQVVEVFARTVQYRVDDVSWTDIEGVETTFDITSLSDGAHLLTVRAVDHFGRSETVSATFVVDNTPPTLSAADMPERGAHVAGDHILGIHVDDAVGIESFTVSVDGGSTVPGYFDPSSGHYAWTFETDLLDVSGQRVYPDGPVSLVFTATDAAGHTTNLEWSLYVDNTGPDLVVVSPKGTQKGNVVFKVTASDPSDVDGVQVRLGSEGWQTMEAQPDGSWTLEWATGVDDNDEALNVQFVAVDSLGNSEAAIETIEVDNFDWTPVMLVILLVFLVLAYLLRDRLRPRGAGRIGDVDGPGPLDEEPVEVELDEGPEERDLLKAQVEEGEIAYEEQVEQEGVSLPTFLG